MTLPELPWAAWRPTKETLHLLAQIVGKVKLAVGPPRNHWWHVTLALDAHGLTTGPLRRADVTYSLSFDFLEHALVLRTSTGEERRIALVDGLSVSRFDAELHAALAGLGLDVAIVERPFGTPVSEIPFPDDHEHATYDPAMAHAFWSATDWAGGVLEEFAGWFCGKQSPVQLYWHSFDLAVTRFSGRRAPAAAGADPVSQEAYSHEVVSSGFWSGDADVGQAAFYSYTAPEPDGLTERPLAPAAARWQEAGAGHLAFLPYDAVRTAPDPRAALLGFLQSAYDAGAEAAGWDREALSSSFCPSPAQLKRLVVQTRSNGAA